MEYPVKFNYMSTSSISFPEKSCKLYTLFVTKKPKFVVIFKRLAAKKIIRTYDFSDLKRFPMTC